MATVILAGFFFPKVSATGAKAGLAFGLLFYIIFYLNVQVDLHFVHFWGIEFLLIVLIMHLVSMLSPRTNPFKITDVGAVDLEQWKYAKALSIALVLVTLAIYILLGNVG